VKTASTLAISCLVAFSMAHAVATPVFTWVDRDGVTHYSESPPEDDSVESFMIELEQAPAAGPAQDDDYFSVVNQAGRMEKSRLENEKARTERLQAEAEVRQAAAASQPRPTSNDTDTNRYYLAYPNYGYRPGYRPGFKPGLRPGHRPGHGSGHRPGRPGQSPGHDYGSHPSRPIVRGH
jgi:hypothetical protein